MAQYTLIFSSESESTLFTKSVRTNKEFDPGLTLTIFSKSHSTLINPY